jgi:hypothetical protein
LKEAVMSQENPTPDRVRVSGPLARLADGFRVDLLDWGYSLWGAQEQLYLLAHVSRWMESEGLELAALTPAALERYFVWRQEQGYLQRSLAEKRAPAVWLPGPARSAAG